MPNWKTYESSVRLLSAIIAAHPNLKLNYDETSTLFGDGCTPKALMHRMTQARRDGDALKEAVARGEEPAKVILSGSTSQSKAKELSKHYGDNCTAKAVQRRLDKLKPDAAGFREAVAAGIDPFTIPLTPHSSEGTKDISDRFGGDCTKSAVENRFRRIKTDAKLINDALSNKIDPITLPIGDTNDLCKYMGSDTTPGGIEFQFRRIKAGAKSQKAAVVAGNDPKDIEFDPKGKAEISKCMGEDTTAGGIRFQFSDRIKPGAQRQLAALAAGEDPQFVEVDIKGAKGKTAQLFGSDVTPKAISEQISKIWKARARLQRAALDRGEDPKDIVFDGVTKELPKAKATKQIVKYYPEATASALEHRFRPIKRTAIELREAFERDDTNDAVADKFGEGVTGKAVSERMVRMKREPAWDLTGTGEESGNGTASAKATPRKRGTPKKKAVAHDDAGSDDEETFTPSKKGALNKVKGGRVSKARGKNGNGASMSLDNDDIIKSEGGGYGDSQDFDEPLAEYNEDNYDIHGEAQTSYGRGYTQEDYEA
ncbi:hypothetical protein PVAG01_04679 [Phlyctema vagabunda]|uniref:Uncharacterized protein n=1 Tax=Phlyctema vagabunda TaxID=108571 RepID=A0ABR4PIK9_9HELO